MSGWIGAIVVIALLAIGFVAYARPDIAPSELVGIVWGAMALMLVSGAAYGYWRFREHPRAALMGVIFWPVLILAIVWAYETFG